jgi:hypothetical protein
MTSTGQTAIPAAAVVEVIFSHVGRGVRVATDPDGRAT